MNGRVRAIGTGLLVTATSVAVIGVATAAADGETGAPRRPEAHRAALPTVDPSVRAKIDQLVVQKFTEAVNTARWYEWATAELERERAEAVAAEAARAARAAQPSSTTSSGNVLDCIKHRESRGQYGAVNSSSGAAGAYQFMPTTWNNTARSAGRPDLVGVNPANASAADQDALAQHLLATQGLGPWGGHCG